MFAGILVTPLITLIEENVNVLEAVVRRCFVKQVFLEISQNSQENTCARASLLIKLKASVFNFITGTGVFLWILRNL